MNNLTIDVFINSANDLELSEYKVLAALKFYSDQLHKNKLYPAFSDLVEINSELEYLIENRENFCGEFPNRLVGIDLTNYGLKYKSESNNLTSDDINKVISFAEWALPKIRTALDEGSAIYDFIDSTMELKEVEFSDNSASEGFIIIPDHYNRIAYIYKFELTQVIASDVPFHTLKTKFIDGIDEESESSSIENIKIDLLRKFPEIINPVIYELKIDLDFPFNETIFPVAKRKLMRYLAA